MLLAQLRFQTRALLLIVHALILSSCTSSGGISFLGYTSDSHFDASIRTIRVPVFRNETFYRGLEFQLTQAVIQKIEQRTPWKVVQQGYGDAELTGIIRMVQKRIPLVNPLNEVREGEYLYTVEITFTDLRQAAASPSPPPAAPADPLMTQSANPSLVSSKTVIVRSRNFVPELGQSSATARQQLVEDLAEQIVNMLESPW
ncbi:MAG: LPS assembly lipoprotein LptE [Gemmatales bacterium]|nr:LPS assembly lipoprotein LptE [Gemmatales bacterium]MDW8223522.1 LPS assembly lipoprotein LptE [Gemmatales bacterium]